MHSGVRSNNVQVMHYIEWRRNSTKSDMASETLISSGGKSVASRISFYAHLCFSSHDESFAVLKVVFENGNNFNRKVVGHGQNKWLANTWPLIPPVPTPMNFHK